MIRPPDGYVYMVDWPKAEVRVSPTVGGHPGPLESCDLFDVDPQCGFHPGMPVWRKAASWYGFTPDGFDIQPYKIEVVPCTPKKCTCGTQIVGGLCSSWCDLVRPAEAEEPEPETEPSPRPGGIGRLICWGADGRWRYLDNGELVDNLTTPKP